MVGLKQDGSMVYSAKVFASLHLKAALNEYDKLCILMDGILIAGHLAY